MMAEPRASASGQPGTRVNWIFNPMPTRALILFGILAAAAVAQPADLILYNAKIVTVDSQFHIADSLAVRADRILAVGARDDLVPRAQRVADLLRGEADRPEHLSETTNEIELVERKWCGHSARCYVWSGMPTENV